MKTVCTKGGYLEASVAGNVICKTCGFEAHEAKRRNKIPLTVRESDGLRRKVIRRKK